MRSETEERRWIHVSERLPIGEFFHYLLDVEGNIRFYGVALVKNNAGEWIFEEDHGLDL